MSVSKYLKVKLNDQNLYNLHFMDWGNIDCENVLLCVHGLTRNSRDFDKIAETLSKNYNYRVISIDMPGRGRSEYLPDPNMYSYENYNLATLSLIDQLSLKKIDYLGSSMGGVLSMHISLHRPDLFRKLILNDVGTFIPKSSLIKISKYVLIYPSFDNFEQAKEHLKIKLARFGIKSAENWDYVTKHSTHFGPNDRLILDYDLNVVNWMKGMNEENAMDIDLDDLWKKVQYEHLLLIRGEKSDLFLRDNALEMIKNRNNSSFIELKGCGHTPSLMEEDQIKPVVDWLVG